MMHFLSAIEQLPFSRWVLESPSRPGPYAIIIFLHSIGMAFVAGLAGALAIRLLGFGSKTPLKPLERVYPFIWWGFALNLVTGSILLMADATTKPTNPDFWVKMFFVISGIIVLKRMRKNVFAPAAPDATIPPAGAKGLAWLTLICWIGAITAGRLLAYVGPVSGVPGLNNR